MFWMTEEQIKEHYAKKAKKAIAKENAKTEYRRQVLENRKSLIPKLLEIKQLKAKLKEPRIRRRISNILLFIAVLMTVVTTLTTVAGGIGYRNTLLTMLTFILFVSFAQGTILLISCIKPYLSNKAPRYLAISTLLQLCLLLVSISFNYIFLYNKANNAYIAMLNIILCIVFDITILVLCELSFVIRLNVQFTNRPKSRVKAILSSVLDRKLDTIETRLLDRTTSNQGNIKPLEIEDNSSIADMDRDAETCQNDSHKVLKFPDTVHDRDRENIKKTIYSYKDGNQIPSISALMELTGLSKNRIIEIKKQLEDEGFIETKGNKTYLIKEM
jgi:hypothetical protein